MEKTHQTLHIEAESPEELCSGLPNNRFTIAELITAQLGKLGVQPTKMNGVSVEVSVRNQMVDMFRESILRIGLKEVK